MKRRAFVYGAAATAAALPFLGGCAATPGAAEPAAIGSGDLGLVVERATGSLAVVNTSRPAVLGRIEGLGDLSHASIVYARDGARGFVFGRDGALTRVNLLTRRIEARVQQAGNSDADAICIADLSDPARPQVTRLDGIGRQPYDALLTPDGRHYIAGLFGEDGLALVDLWAERPQVKRVLGGYGRGQQPLPVYKMPHLRGWAVAGREAWLPAIGHHEVLVADTTSWTEVGRVAVAGQPVFVMAQPDGRRVWVNFALPDYHKVQVIDVPTRRVVHGFEPGRAVLHLEFTPRGEAVWISARDDDRVLVVDTASWRTLATLEVRSPSGIFFTARAARVGL